MMQDHLVLTGIPAAPGLAHGKTLFLKQQEFDVPQFDIEDVDQEIQRMHFACEEAQVEIVGLKDSVGSRAKGDEAAIFEAHKMILEDVALIDRAEKAIHQGTNAEKAWIDAIEFFAQMMEQIPDETLSSRAVDIRDVGRRVLGHLLGVKMFGTALETPAIILGQDLAPSDTAGLDKNLVLAFCTASGGPTSHTAILAKAFGLPAVVGIGEQLLSVSDGTLVLVDGDKGEVHVDPSDEFLTAFIAREEAATVKLAVAREAAQSPAVTADGEHVEVVANVGGVVDAPLGIKNGAEGVGLFRTEFLYLDRKSMPTEDEQIEAYVSVFSNYPGMPVVVRLLDIGGDKVIPYLNLPQELNPFLGWRGIRMLDGADEIFSHQFRALLQAGAQSDVDLKIMAPMVSGLAEVRAAKALLVKAKDELAAEGKTFLTNVEFGIMVEVPSAALLADRLAKEVDFFSIGTNDLTQYTLAVDRTNSRVAHLANSLNPAVLALIKHTIDCAHAEGKWVGLCGELAGEPLATPILLGMGLDEFSMSPARVPVIKQVMRELHQDDCQRLAAKVLTLSDDAEVIQACQAFLSERGLMD
ncbi:MAG: phosphoenolpyruvate--protein phosphotransferase [Brevefilum sp.]|nr:phosphoenolpyruvate--protein phosphotransferase [Brevefilum sp.]